MKASIIAFSDRGMIIAEKIANEFGCCYERCTKDGLNNWTQEHFEKDDLLIFIGSCGIAVRAIAPYVSSKLTDPAVVVVDELKKHVIPILSGHVGKANQYANKIANVILSEPVITTASDLNNRFSIDSFAVEYGLQIQNPKKIKSVTSRILSGLDIKLKTDLTFFKSYFERIDGFDVVEEDYDIYITYKAISEDVLILYAPVLTVGIGCKKGTSVADIEKIYASTLNDNGLSPLSVSKICSIDLKADESGIIDLCNKYNLKYETFTSEELNSLDDLYGFSKSDFVKHITGTDNVCERSAIKGSISTDGCLRPELIVHKISEDGVTIAIAKTSFISPKKKLYVVGIGPGKGDGMTIEAKHALDISKVIIGYTKYIELIRPIFPEKEMLSTPMLKEIERVRLAYEMACKEGLASIICSGDAGVYGMASPVLELMKDYPDVEVEIIPGVSAVLSGSAVLGAMIAHDFCVISLSDLLTPWTVIENRLECAAKGDFCIAIYNPSSNKRRNHLKKACEILLRYKNENTLCGVVRNIGRMQEEKAFMSLSELKDYEADMFTTVFIGNDQSYLDKDKGITKRGYHIE